MSNPCINRWGLNSFWSHSWYSDNRYSLYAKQDHVVLNLLKIYLMYGANTPKSVFKNSYWFKSLTLKHSLNFSYHYRWITVRNKTLQMTSTYPMRIAREETFDARVSVLRFNSWFVVNSYWFQPDKQRKHRMKKAKIKDHLSIHHGLNSSHSVLPKLRKLLTLAHSSKYNF